MPPGRGGRVADETKFEFKGAGKFFLMKINPKMAWHRMLG